MVRSRKRFLSKTKVREENEVSMKEITRVKGLMSNM